MSSRAVTRQSLGGWLLKRTPGSARLAEVVPTRPAAAAPCVRPSYRTELVAAGDPVLLWVSGGRTDVPAGIHAQGRARGPVGPVGESGRLAVPVRWRPLSAPVLRRELLAHPVLRELEVLRMPAGSNPSFVTREQLDELCALFPQLTADC
ncbi:MAG TPA: hypothetical protein VD814_10010 [Nocardioides sp.]|nr:hypothetical protein [Nocardioides sp.]